MGALKNHVNQLNLQLPPHGTQAMNYSYFSIFILVWKERDCDWAKEYGAVILYTLSVSVSPSKAARGNETKCSHHVSLSKVTLVYILTLFKWHAPNRGQQLSIHMPSFGTNLYTSICTTYCIYLYICISALPPFLQSSLWEFLQCLAGCRVREGNEAQGVPLLIDVGDITYHIFLLQVNNISVTQTRWLYPGTLWDPIMRPGHWVALWMVFIGRC